MQEAFGAGFYPDSEREKNDVGTPAGRRPAGGPISVPSRLCSPAKTPARKTDLRSGSIHYSATYNNNFEKLKDVPSRFVSVRGGLHGLILRSVSVRVIFSTSDTGERAPSIYVHQPVQCWSNLFCPQSASEQAATPPKLPSLTPEAEPNLNTANIRLPLSACVKFIRLR